MGRQPDRAAGSTTELLRRVRQGDRSAENEIASRNLPELRRWARGRLPPAARDGADTEDLVQDTFIQALRHLPTFDATRPGAFQAYLRAALKNRVVDAVRRSRRRPAPEALEEHPDPGPAPDVLAADRQQEAVYVRALEQLRPVDRALILARVDRAWSYAQIARAFDRPTPNAGRVAVARAVQRLLLAADAQTRTAAAASAAPPRARTRRRRAD